MKNFHKFLGAAMLFCFMMLSSVDATAQQYGQKTVQLKQMYEVVHGEFANNAIARQAFHATTANLTKWDQVVDFHESSNSTSANQMALLNEFYDKLSARTQQ